MTKYYSLPPAKPPEGLNAIENVINAYRVGDDPDAYTMAELLADLRLYADRNDLNWSVIVGKADSFVGKSVVAYLGGDSND